MQGESKISFGFTKQLKKPAVIQTAPKEQNIQLVECLEGNSIKIKDAKEETHQPLVIPIREDKRNLIDRLKERKEKQNPVKENSVESDNRADKDLTLNELAVREVIRDAQNKLLQNSSNDKQYILPSSENNVDSDGQEEPTLEDYEAVPISDYGMAMLRGMGWKEGMPIGKNVSKVGTVQIPDVRPKGLGLGASSLIEKNKNLDKQESDLMLTKGQFAKIIAGPKQGVYCKVLGLDDEAGRVMVVTAPENETLSLNEFMVVPVKKEEYIKGSRVLNNAMYEKYSSDRSLEIKKEEDMHIKSSDKTDAHKYQDQRSKSRRHSSESDSESSSSSSLRNSHSKDYSGRKSHKSSHDRHRNKPCNESDYKIKQKKNKCKTRHRRNSHSERKKYRDRK